MIFSVRATGFSDALFVSQARTICVSLFFLTVLLLGLNIYQDYGISWDEPHSRFNGFVTLNYLRTLFAPGLFASNEHFPSIPPLSDYADRDYGVAFEAPLGLFERIPNSRISVTSLCFATL